MLENILEVIKPLISGIGYTTLIGLSLTAIARFVPNDKLHSWGYKIGTIITVAGVARFGQVWEKVEDFLANSIGMILTGIKSGLDSNDNSGQSTSLKPEQKDDVNI